MKKIKLLFSSFLPVVAALGVQLAAMFLVTFWFSVVTVIRLIIEGITDPNQLMSGLTTLLTDALFNDILMIVTFVSLTVVFFLWFRKQKDKTPATSLSEVFTIRNYSIFIISGLAAQVAVSMCLNLILPFFPNVMESYTQIIESLIGGSVIVSVICTALLAPVAEELIFRELMLNKLGKLFPFWFANIIQALAFGIYHMNIVQGIYAFVLGLLFGWVAHRMKSVWASVMLHGVVNASGLVLDIILPDALFESTSGMIIFAVLCSAITILLSLLYRFPENEEPILESASPLIQETPAEVSAADASDDSVPDNSVPDDSVPDDTVSDGNQPDSL